MLKFFKLVLQFFGIMCIMTILSAFTYAKLFPHNQVTKILDWSSIFVGIGTILFSYILRKDYSIANNKFSIIASIVTVLAILKFIFVYLF